MSRNPAAIAQYFRCPQCGQNSSLDAAERLTEKCADELLGTSREQRIRRTAWIYGATGREFWSRPATADDDALLGRVQAIRLPGSVPRAKIPWGDLHRSGYHHGISHVHHFYTHRNLVVFGRLWERVNGFSEKSPRRSSFLAAQL